MQVAPSITTPEPQVVPSAEGPHHSSEVMPGYSPLLQPGCTMLPLQQMALLCCRKHVQLTCARAVYRSPMLRSKLRFRPPNPDLTTEELRVQQVWHSLAVRTSTACTAGAQYRCHINSASSGRLFGRLLEPRAFAHHTFRRF